MPPSTALVAGALANKPGNGGEAWVRLSWALGLERLGFRVVFVEQIDPLLCSLAGVRFFQEVTRDHGLEHAALLAGPEAIVGPSRDELLDDLAGAELLVNLSGNLRDPELAGRCRRRVYVDLDPGYTQLWHAAGLDLGLAGHHLYVTVGSQVGRAGCDLPVSGIDWQYVPPPVVLDEWPTSSTRWTRFTSVGSWRGGYGRLERNGQLYGQKAHELRKVRDLPRTSAHAFELALDISGEDEQDRLDLVASGWQLVDPQVVAGDPDRFRRYVQSSGAEFSAAQGIYVETRCGWVGDRTVRYLASGKPALVQDTGLDGALPTGEGLVTYTSFDDAAAAAQRIVDDYESHCAAGRRLAEEIFDSDRVLGRLLEGVGAAP
jgi:hypothetical protein